MKTSEFLKHLNPGELIYPALLRERTGLSPAAVACWLLRLHQAGYLIKNARGIYKVSETPPTLPWRMALGAPTKNKPKPPPKPKKFVEKRVVIKPALTAAPGMVERAINNQHPLAAAWGSVHA